MQQIQLLTGTERSVIEAFLRPIPANESLSEHRCRIDLEVRGGIA